MSHLQLLTDAYLSVPGDAALTPSLIADVTAACEAVEDSGKDTVLLVHLRDAPANECWHDDVRTHLVNRWERALRRLERLPAPTVAVVDGVCHGPALEVLLATDYRIATGHARLRLPTAAHHTWPGMSMYRLANQVGVARSRALALFGIETPAAQAASLGLIDEVTNDTVAAVRTAVKFLGAHGGREVAVRRQLLFEAMTTSFEDALGTHLAACDRTLRLCAVGADASSAMLTPECAALTAGVTAQRDADPAGAVPVR